MDGWMGRWIDGWMDRDRLMSGWTDGLMGRWMDEDRDLSITTSLPRSLPTLLPWAR